MDSRRVINLETRELSQRVKEIAGFTIEDYFNLGYNFFDEDIESVTKVVHRELARDSYINDAQTYKISLSVLKILDSLNIVDMNFIEKTLFKGGKR